MRKERKRKGEGNKEGRWEGERGKGEKGGRRELWKLFDYRDVEVIVLGDMGIFFLLGVGLLLLYKCFV